MDQRNVPSRPTTPLRPSSRTSLRSNTSFNPYASTGGEYVGHYMSSGDHRSFYGGTNPLASLETAFAELADGFADLEANMMHLQLLHESVSRFSENFAAFLYGMNVNAFCVDFPEAPVAESFRRMATKDEEGGGSTGSNTAGGATAGQDLDPDITIVSTATSFVDHPASAGASGSRAGRHGTRGAGAGVGGAVRGGPGASATGVGRGGPAARSSTIGRGRASGIARGSRGRGIR